METSTVQALAGYLPYVLLAAMVFTNWKRGSSSASKEVIDLREKQISALKDEIKRIDDSRREDKKLAEERNHQSQEKFTQEIKELTGKVGELNGALNAKTEENKKLTEILTNRNPEMEEFFKQCKGIFPTIEKLVGLMDKIDKHLDK